MDLLLDGSLFLRSGREQRTDAQRDLLLVLVDGDDLSIDLVAFGQNVGGLVDTAVRDLGNVDQTGTPGTTSANAPKVISLTMRTLATSPTL